MAQNMRTLVASGYAAGHYATTYARTMSTPEPFEQVLCDELLSRLHSKASILDLGCGVGLPYDAYFSKKGGVVTGIDLSEKHIVHARKNVAGATFLVGDFFSKEIKGTFDAIVSFYALFHIPRTEHTKLFAHMHSLLKKNGLILITLGVDSMKLSVNKDFAGAPMAWSSYAAEKNKKLVQAAGFEILIAAEDYRTERHLWLLAKKK
ncbi:MAG: class I SAM-dependent methyltransferase [Candidatus Woesearchaeota archaeon]|nr:MAG: class I SAM-dependent methyltransferase [Candidatus Woesearchaeota archaeon]